MSRLVDHNGPFGTLIRTDSASDTSLDINDGLGIVGSGPILDLTDTLIQQQEASLNRPSPFPKGPQLPYVAYIIHPFDIYRHLAIGYASKAFCSNFSEGDCFLFADF